MTIGAWIGLAVCWTLVLFFVTGALAACEAEKNTWIIGMSITFVLLTLLSGLFIWYRSTSESGRRAMKDQQSNLNGGINRTVSVYDINGNLIKEYTGKFDIEKDRNSYILFDDENGNRHVIYYTTGTIIIDEK